MKSLLLGLLVIFLSHPICAGEAKTTNTKLPEILKPAGKDYVDSVFESLLDKDLQVKSYFHNGTLCFETKGLNLTELKNIIDLKYMISIGDIVDAGTRCRSLRQISFLMTEGKAYSISRELYNTYVKELKKCEHGLSRYYASGFRAKVRLFIFRGERLDYIIEVTSDMAREFSDIEDRNVSIYAMLHDENGKIMDYRLILVNADTEECVTAGNKIWGYLNIGGIVKDRVLGSLFLPRGINDQVLPLDEFIYEYFCSRIESLKEHRKYYEDLREKIQKDIHASKSKESIEDLNQKLKERNDWIKEVDELSSRLETKLRKYQKKTQGPKK